MKDLKLFQAIDFEQVNEYESLRKKNLVGFAHLFLWQESKKDDQIDIQVYNKLIELDSKLGTTASEQLYGCIECTSRSDIIKVEIIVVNTHILIFLDYEL